jgi:hypothetical protein
MTRENKIIILVQPSILWKGDMAQQNSVPQPQKKQFSKGIIVGIAIITIVLVSVFLFVFSTFINKPNPQITLVNGYEGFQGLNYVWYVDVSVKNNGASGWVKVYAEISGAGKYEQKDQRIYLGNGETDSLQFVFDISILGSLGNPTITYRAWANAD